MLALPSVVAFELGLPHKLIGGAVDDTGTPLYRVRVATVDGRCAPRQLRGAPEHDASILPRPTQWSFRASSAGGVEARGLDTPSARPSKGSTRA